LVRSNNIKNLHICIASKNTLNFYFTVAFYVCESKLVYNCQKGFSKFGSNCYHLSKETATWQEAFFECKYLAKGSKLVVLAKHVDDHNIRKFLKYRKNGNFLNLLNSYYCR